MELGQKYEAALLKAATAKSAALKAEKLSKRVYSACFLESTGSVAQREHEARTNVKFIAAEDDWIAKEHAANLAQAEADAVHVSYETWRTQEASRRAEMTIR